MNTCYCTRSLNPHTRTPECESHRIDRLIRRRETERQLWRRFPDGFSFDEPEIELFVNPDVNGIRSW